MSKKQKFIDYVACLFDEGKDIPQDALDYWNAFTAEKNVEKSQFTENGKRILTFLKENDNIESWKSKDIAEALQITSRSVSGSMRKLVSDEYVEKIGQDPIFYTLTQKGKEVQID